MNSATKTTLLMLVLAIGSVAAAMYYYPWEEITTVDAEVGKPLFEDYKVADVRGIDILQFNSDRQVLDRMKLVRRGEKWVIPARQEFEASESARVAVAVNSLNDRTVYEVMSENQEDHIKFGVVDPAEISSGKNVAAFGRKLTLTDRNNKTIADVIIGSALKDSPGKRYVRIPGKPRVYLIDFDQVSMAGLITNFSGWVSPNLLDLQTRQDENGRQLRKVTIDNYRIEAEEDSPVRKQPIYQATLAPVSGRLEVKSLTVAKQGALEKVSTTPRQDALLKGAVLSLLRLSVDDVGRKDLALVDAFSQPSADKDDNRFDQLPTIGFYNKGLEPSGWNIESANGRVDVSTTDGVKSTISIGRVGSANSAGGGKLNYFVMINSGVDFEYLKEPIRPAGLKNDESDENKAFLRTVEAWKSAVDKASQAARELNAVHGDWYYLVSDSVINALRPDIEDSSAASTVSDEDSADPEKESETENKKAVDSGSSDDDSSQNPENENQEDN